METVQNTNVSISELLLEIIKPSVVSGLGQRLLLTYRIRTCSSDLWVIFDQSDSLWASRKAQRCDSLQSCPRESRAWHGCLWVTAEHWQSSATGSRIRLGGKASLPAHLIYFWFVRISKTETKSTLSWLLWKTDTWMALCIVYSVVLEHCCAVSTLLCGSHSSGQFTGFPEHLSSSFTWATCLTTSEFSLGSGAQGDFHGNWWPFSTISLCQGWLSTAAFITHWALECFPLSRMRKQYHWRYFFISAEEAPENLWRCGGLSRESFMLIYALLLGEIWQNILKIL